MAIKTDTFNIFEIPDDAGDDILKIVENWHSIASAKCTDDPSTRVFQDSKSVCNMVFDCIKESSGLTTVLCIDSKARPQAIALFASESYEISWLLSHPNNIKHPINAAIADRVNGAASSIIDYLAKKAARSERPLKVSSFTTSVPFYQRLGFEFEPDGGDEELRMILPLRLP